jgi:putative transposase
MPIEHRHAQSSSTSRWLLYRGPHCYFLTICCHQRERCFEDDASAVWLVSQVVQLFPSKRFAVIAYCVMPDHIHLLLEGATDGADLRVAMHDWKQQTGFEWKRRTKQRLWQSGYFEYVLRDEDSVSSIVRYIVSNPVRAGIAEDIGQYPHTGSSRYRLEELTDAVSDWRPRRRRV